jgi:hypothetical protein
MSSPVFYNIFRDCIVLLISLLLTLSIINCSFVFKTQRLEELVKMEKTYCACAVWIRSTELLSSCEH